VVTYRYVGLGRTFLSVAATVDHDDERSTGVYIAPGAPEESIRMGDGSYLPRVIPPGFFERRLVAMEERLHGGRPSLRIWQPGSAHAVHIHWRGDEWLPDGFYVNLQEPVTETPQGFETTDLFLDIVVDADLNWRWKDEDELEEAVAVGRITPREAEAVRIEGERVAADIESRRWPFDGSFDDWRPDPAWPLPALPKERIGTSNK
jgi:hypothetical protein